MAIRESLQEAVRVIGLIEALEEKILDAARRLERVLLGGGKLLTCGNGGSAADGSHLATEIACRFIENRRPYPAFSLTADSSLLTATGNDYSFAEIFARQVVAYGCPGDILVAISTSGNSQNVVRALEQAKAGGLQTISLLGHDGGRCRGRADVELVVPHAVTARIQEAHKLIIHLFCEQIEPALQRGPASAQG
ncbi:MAG TPA: SIS domain-containing protein [Chthoniobacterales bacterium]